MVWRTAANAEPCGAATTGVAFGDGTPGPTCRARRTPHGDTPDADALRTGAMDDLQSSEEAAFVAEDVSNIIKETIDSVLQHASYNHNKVGQWTSNVVERTLKRLTQLNKPFKYVVTAVIMQKNGAGLHTASSCYWDNTTDGSRTVRWENKTMYCIASVFGLGI